MSCMWENKQQLKARSGHILSCYMRSAKEHLLTRGAALIRTRSFLFRPRTSESELDAWKSMMNTADTSAILLAIMWQGPFGIMRPSSFLILSSGCSSFPSSSFSFLTCSSILSQCFLHPHYSCYLWVLLGPKILLASHVFQFVSLFSQFFLPFLTPFYFPTHSTLSVAVSV